VLFGDATNGSSAQITGHTASSITVKVPTPPPSFTFTTEPCDANGDGVQGTKKIDTAISVTVRNLDGTGCAVTLSNAFTLIPPDTSCNEPAPPPVAAQCSDGKDNDGDGLTDFGAAPSNDPQCLSAGDNNEAS
jgi:hypothetical protein